MNAFIEAAHFSKGLREQRDAARETHRSHLRQLEADLNEQRREYGREARETPGHEGEYGDLLIQSDLDMATSWALRVVGAVEHLAITIPGLRVENAHPRLPDMAMLAAEALDSSMPAAIWKVFAAEVKLEAARRV